MPEIRAIQVPARVYDGEFEEEAFSNFARSTVIVQNRLVKDWSEKEGWGIYETIFHWPHENELHVHYGIYKKDTVNENS